MPVLIIWNIPLALVAHYEPTVVLLQLLLLTVRLWVEWRKGLANPEFIQLGGTTWFSPASFLYYYLKRVRLPPLSSFASTHITYSIRVLDNIRYAVFAWTTISYTHKQEAYRHTRRQVYLFAQETALRYYKANLCFYQFKSKHRSSSSRTIAQAHYVSFSQTSE